MITENIQQKEIRVGTKNAYEIRTEVLSLAMDFIKWQNKTENITPKSVLEIAELFYSFVENRK